MGRSLRSFFRSPLGKTLLLSLGIFAIYLVLILVRGGVMANLYQVLVDGFLCTIGLFLWVLFFSQFVLPVRTFSERLLAIDRFLTYLIGQHGPAIFIENGNIRKSEASIESGKVFDEMHRRGPGVVLLDTASAALLRTPVRYTRPVGPGVAFINATEYVGGTVDLHIQKQKIGPNDHENPFAPSQEEESETAYQARQNRRSETRGFTRDGIEVVPNITVRFRIDADPGEGFTEFGYRPSSVERAIRGRPVNPSLPPDSPERTEEWKRLPAYLAADIWREMASKFTLAELFQQAQNQPGAMGVIKEQILARLQRSTFQPLDNFGRLVDKKIQSESFRRLQERGLRVIELEITHLRFSEQIEEQLLQNWKSNWLIRALQEKDNVERQRGYVSELGRKGALSEYANAVVRYLKHQPDDSTLNGKEILKRLIDGSLYLCYDDPQLNTLITDELNQLKELRAWIEKSTGTL